MDNNNATEKCNTNLESSEPGLQDRLYLKLLGPTLESKKRHGIRYYVFYQPRLYSAPEAILDVLKEEDPQGQLRIYWHSWSGSVEELLAVISAYKKNMIFGFSPVNNLVSVMFH